MGKGQRTNEREERPTHSEIGRGKIMYSNSCPSEEYMDTKTGPKRNRNLINLFEIM